LRVWALTHTHRPMARTRTQAYLLRLAFWNSSTWIFYLKRMIRKGKNQTGIGFTHTPPREGRKPGVFMNPRVTHMYCFLAWRGAETWGFHESPSYPHVLLSGLERKNWTTHKTHNVGT
jgi:hypothetical protein